MSGTLKSKKTPITAEGPEIEILCSIYCDYSNDLETDEKSLTKEHLETIRLYTPNAEGGFIESLIDLEYYLRHSAEAKINPNRVRFQVIKGKELWGTCKLSKRLTHLIEVGAPTVSCGISVAFIDHDSRGFLDIGKRELDEFSSFFNLKNWTGL